MAAIPIYIIGTITTAAPKGGEVSGSGIEQCVISGLASIEGLGVGGGPVIPPPQQPPGGGDKPPGIWPGPGPLPHPEHPIAPGGPPPGIWPGPGPLPHPEHPIVLPPDEGTKPPDPVQPPVEWKAVWHPTEGWMVVGVPTVPHPSPSA